MRSLPRVFVIGLLAAQLGIAYGGASTADWVHLDQVPQEEFLSIHTDGSELFAGGSGIIYTLTDCNSFWVPSSPISATADHGSALIQFDGRLFAGTFTEGVFESTDGGENWVPRNSGLNGLGALTTMGFAVRGDSLYLATGGAGVYVMPLQGAPAWSAYRDGLGASIEWTVNSIVAVGDALIAGAGANGTAARRPAGAAAWQSFEFSEFLGVPLMMLALGSHGGLVYGVGSDGLYVSADSGQFWEQYLTNVGLLGDGAIAISGNDVFAMIQRAGQGTRIYRRVQNTWASFDQLDGVLAYEMAIHCNRIYLAAADGVWYRELDVTDAPGNDPVLPSELSLQQNHPNPFNLSTSIAFAAGKHAKANLSVYNILGQLVAVLVDEDLMIGSYTVEWDGTGRDGEPVPSGIYFYRLTVGDQTATHKMVMVK